MYVGRFFYVFASGNDALFRVYDSVYNMVLRVNEYNLQDHLVSV